MSNKVGVYSFSFTEYNGKYRVKLKINGGLNSNLCSLFNSLELEDIPSFLDDVVNKVSRAGRFGGFFKGPIFEQRFNEKDLDIRIGQVQIGNGGSNFNESEIIDLSLFYEISVNFAHKCLEAVTWFGLIEKGLVTEVWIEEIKEWICKIESELL